MQSSAEKRRKAIFYGIGFAIIILSVVLAGVYGVLVIKPMAIQKMQAGTWTVWDEILDKAIVVSIVTVAFLIGSFVLHLPDEGWSWRRALSSSLLVTFVMLVLALVRTLARYLGLLAERLMGWLPELLGSLFGG